MDNLDIQIDHSNLCKILKVIIKSNVENRFEKEFMIRENFGKYENKSRYLMWPPFGP